MGPVKPQALVAGAVLGLALAGGSGAAPAAGEGATPSLERAMEAWAAGEHARAREEFGALVSAQPGNLEARMRLAGLHLSQGRYRDGIRQYQEAIAIDAGNDRAFIGLGLAYLHAGESGPAHAALEEAVRLNPARYKELEPLLQKLSDRQPHPVPHVDGDDPSEEASARPFMPPHGGMGR